MAYAFNPFTGSFDYNVGTAPTFTDVIVTTSLTIGVNPTDYTFPAADGPAGWILQTDGAGTLTWVAKPSSAEWTDAGTFLYPNEIADNIIIGAATELAATINLNADGTSRFKGVMTLGTAISPYALPATDGASGDVLTSNGGGTVSWVAPSVAVNAERHFLHSLMGA